MHQLSFRPASLLDVPFMFNLIQEGSELGSFSDRFLNGKGAFTLLYSLLSELLSWQKRELLPDKNGAKKFLIFQDGEQPLGFVEVSIDAKNPVLFWLDYFSICPELRRQGLGRKMLEILIAQLKRDTVLVALCTPRAKVMKHLLKKIHFRRQPQSIVPQGGCGLDLYYFSPQDSKSKDIVGIQRNTEANFITGKNEAFR